MVQSCHGVDNERERERDFGDSMMARPMTTEEYGFGTLE